MKYKKKTKRDRSRRRIALIAAAAVCVLAFFCLWLGISSYINAQKWSDYNEYARNIFYAAQSALDDMTEDEQAELRQSIARQSAQEGTEVYIQVKGSADSSGAGLFEQLTEGYIYDTSKLLDSSVGVEIDFASGQIISAAFADDSMILTNEGIDGKNYINYKDKTSKDRRSLCIGYYDRTMAQTQEEENVLIGNVSLVNGDTLEAVWQLPSEYRMRIGQYAYRIVIEDSGGEHSIELMLNSSGAGHLLPANDISEETSAEVSYEVRSGGIKTDSGTFSFPAYIDSSYNAHLVLDAIDTAAAQVLEAKEDSSSYKDTYSGMRLASAASFDICDTVRVSVCAVYEDGSSGEFKTSGEENLLMGEGSSPSDYTIQNGRHLYNIRFIENATTSFDENKFTQTESFAWGSQNFGIVGAGHVFKNMKKETAACFVPIQTLHSGSVLTAEDGCVMEGLRLNNASADDDFGLFKVNYGSIEQLTINDLQIESSGRRTGGLCGTNSGTISQVTVTGSRIISGSYAGGIAGCQYHGMIAGCSFSGGEVGARTYAGGIAGAIYSGASQIVECSTSAAVYAGESYSGGICGYSSGIMTDVEVNIDIDSEEGKTLLEIIADNGHSGNYAGGIVGMNDGILASTKEIEVSPVVVGRNYVGGIIGYNAEEAETGHYSLNGGYIKGSSCVGGIVGFNTSVSFMEASDYVRSASPNKIYGDYYVGGIIGANVIMPDADTRMIEFKFRVNSENGEITAYGAYAGGVVGYQMCLRDTDTILFEGETPDIGMVLSTADASVQLVAAVGENPASDVKYLAAAVENVENISITSSNTAVRMTSDGTVRLGRISSGLFAGGILGAQQEYSRLIIDSVAVQNTQIHVSEAIHIDDGLFAGGGAFMGKIPRRTTLLKCQAESMFIEHSGSYLGVFAEINEGRIEQCISGGIENEERNGIGGIVGLNISPDEFHGVIYECTLEGPVSGRNNVGGIVSLNRGIIEDSVIGGHVSGRNNVGGIAGKNGGTVQNCEIQENGLLEEDRTISGAENVGGFVGYQQGGSESRVSGLTLTSGVLVKGSGTVGGIAGCASGEGLIHGCESRGMIETEKGSIGGIAGIVTEGVSIRSCSVENAKITAPNADYIGGLAGQNFGTIEDCTVAGNMTLTGTWYVGGIAAYSSGRIRRSSVSEIHLVLKENKAQSCVGGIAAFNSGNIENTATEQGSAGRRNEIHIQSWVNDSYAGGIAGKNSGNITSTNTSVKMNTAAHIELTNHAAATVGGVAGENTGQLRYYRFTGEIEADGSAGYYIGGIVGINGNGVSAALVEGCDVSDSDLDNDRLTKENRMDRTGTYTIRIENNAGVVGGIAGSNEQNSVIRDSTLVQCYIVSGSGSVGGIAGYNNGLVEECKAHETGSADSIRVKIYTEAGFPSGIVSAVGSSGIAKNCTTGDDWYYTGAGY
ncbi:MAG TPA: hypothetical protein IAB53_07515 [Candidatus Scybalocola faecipullorum]|nr:hypothetical protein [Candidatus Scybalocola faecipullorum]